MRSINLSALTRNNKGNYDWMGSVGKIFHVIWDDIECDFMIINIIRKGKHIYVRYATNYIYDREIHETRCEHFIQSRFNHIFIKTKYKIGDIINNNLIVEDIFFKERTDNKHRRDLSYKLRCLKCNRIFESLVSNMDKRRGLCPYCEAISCNVDRSREEILRNRKQYEKYFYNKEDLYRYNISSNEIIKFVCPDCGRIKEMRVSSFYAHEFSCPYCNDGISYPNRLMANLLESINIEFIPEFSDKWTEGKRYDFLLPKYNVLIEMDGSYHYENKRGNLKTNIETDDIKNKKAIENGLKVIRIDCNYSNVNNRFKYIKDNIIESEILRLVCKDPSGIDWDSIELNSSKSLLVKACDIKNANKNMTATDISKILKVSNTTVVTWLKTGNKLGLCNYDTLDQMKKSGLNLSSKYNKIKMLQIICIENKRIYKSLAECSRETKIGKNTIKEVCDGLRESYKGLRFKLVSDLTLEEFTYYNCEQWLKDNDLWDIFMSKNKVV